MYNNIFTLIPQGDLKTRQSGETRAFIPGVDGVAQICIIGGTKKDLDGGSFAYSPEGVVSQKSYWDVINTFENVREKIKATVKKRAEFLTVNIKAPGLKRVDDSSTLSVTDRVLRNTLPAALKSGYLETTDPQWFSWNYDVARNTFVPCLNVHEKGTTPGGIYVLRDDNFRANSCIAASRLLSWLKCIEDTFMKEVGETIALLGDSCPYAKGWTMSFVSYSPNNLFDRKWKARNLEPPTANPRLTIVGTESDIQLLKDFLDARSLPKDFKYRVVKDDLIEKNKGEEELGAIFTGEAVQDELPYGLLMYPAWVTTAGSVYIARRSWSMLKHWIRLPLSSAVDKSDAYYKVLRSVACYGAMPSRLGGYLIATSAGFFHVDDLKKPQVVSYRTLEELNLEEGFPECKPIAASNAFMQKFFGENNERRYLSGARANYFKNHPLVQYGNAEKFIDLKIYTNLREKMFPSMKLRTMTFPKDAFNGTCMKKGDAWDPHILTTDDRVITITNYLQDILHVMFHHEQAIFFKEEKFVNSYSDNFNSYMQGLYKEKIVCDAFVVRLSSTYLDKEGFKEKDYKPLAIGSLYNEWFFAIPHSF